MVADADIQLWLDSQQHAGQVVVIPYVTSVKTMRLTYGINLVQTSGGSRSRINQKGQVNVGPQQAAALSRISYKLPSPTDACEIELTLSEDNKEPRRYHFECPH